MPLRQSNSPSNPEKAADHPDGVGAAAYQPHTRHLLAALWIGEEAELAAYHRGKRVSPIFRMSQIDGLPVFEAFLDETVAAMGFKGKTASLVLDGGPLESTTLTLPPSPSRQQAGFVREKARRLAAEHGALVWEAQRLAAAKSSGKTLLHAIATDAFAKIDAAFATRRIALKKVCPLIAVAPKAFAGLKLQASSSRSLLLAPSGAGFKILSIAADGLLEFARDLSRENGRDPQRVAVELNRCLLFARQQFGPSVSSIVLVGAAASQIGKNLGEQLKSEIPIVQADDAEDFWLRHAAGRNAPINLAKESLVQNRKRFAKQASAVAACLAAGVLAIHYTYQADIRYQQTVDRVERLQARETALLDQLESLEARQERARILTQTIREAERFDRVPIQKALLSALAKELPPNAWIDKLEARWNSQSERWEASVVAKINATPEEAAAARQRLAHALQNSPLRFQSQTQERDAFRQVAIRGNATGAQTIAIEGEMPPTQVRPDDA